MKKIVIFGVGKIADVAFHHITRDSQFEVVAFAVNRDWLPASSPGQCLHKDRPLVAFEEVEQLFPANAFSMFVAIGYHELNAVRAQKYLEAKNKGYELVSYVSPRADTGPWQVMGDNCLILDGVGIQPGATIGNNVSVWNNSLVGHHSSIADHCWLAAGTTVGGASSIGARCFLGLNATVGGEVNIGSDSFLGGGSLVVKSAAEKSVFVERGTEKFRLDSTQFLKMTAMPAMGKSRQSTLGTGS